jgi:hypothetical protein
MSAHLTNGASKDIARLLNTYPLTEGSRPYCVPPIDQRLALIALTHQQRYFTHVLAYIYTRYSIGRARAQIYSLQRAVVSAPLPIPPAPTCSRRAGALIILTEELRRTRTRASHWGSGPTILSIQYLPPLTSQCLRRYTTPQSDRLAPQHISSAARTDRSHSACSFVLPTQRQGAQPPPA